MKKFIIPVLFMICFYSCQKSDKTQNFNHEFTAVPLNQGAKESLYTLSFAAGHTATGCKGCVTVCGVSYHVDCMGAGQECVNSTIVSLVQVSNNNYTATTLDSTALTSEDFYNMPSRSLFVGYDNHNKDIYLNIPAQFVYRDSVSLQFTFTGLYYSDSQIYGNN